MSTAQVDWVDWPDKNHADAETALISYMTQLMEADGDEDAPNSFTMMMAVLRSVSRAAGVLESGHPTTVDPE